MLIPRVFAKLVPPDVSSHIVTVYAFTYRQSGSSFPRDPGSSLRPNPSSGSISPSKACSAYLNVPDYLATPRDTPTHFSPHCYPMIRPDNYMVDGRPRSRGLVSNMTSNKADVASNQTRKALLHPQFHSTLASRNLGIGPIPCVDNLN